MCGESFTNTLQQCVAVCCSGGVLQCVAVCCSVLQCSAVCCSVLQCVAVCCSASFENQGALHCVAACCGVLQPTCESFTCAHLDSPTARLTKKGLGSRFRVSGSGYTV